jgi:probable rRNA maturation factor
MTAGLEVVINSRVRPLPLRPVLRRALRAAAMAEGVPGGWTVSVLVTGDAEIRDLNLRFAGEDAATDVLSFPALDLRPGVPPPAPAEGETELGDIILSIDHLVLQAQQAGHPLEHEAATLAVHGFLHLLGHDHASKREEKRMVGRTAEILELAGVPGSAAAKAGVHPPAR